MDDFFLGLLLVSIGGKADANLAASSLPPLNEITSAPDTEDNLTPNPGESSLDPTFRTSKCNMKDYLCDWHKAIAKIHSN